MSTTNYNWAPSYPRFLADLDGDGRADITGIGADGVWSSIADGAGAFSEPSFRLVAFEANAGWRVADHPRFVVDLTGDGRSDLLGFGDAGIWTALGNGDGNFGEFKFVLAELGLSQGWSAEYPRFLSDLTGDGRPDVVGFGMDGVWVTPKNRERRDVDLISDVVELLAERRDSDARSLNSLVFPGENGRGFLSPTVVLRRYLYPAMAAAEIGRVGSTQEKRTFHSFRHTFAKRALETGAQITWLSRHLGHSSLKVTTDIYGHWERAERKIQAAKMEDAFPV
jgi:hypothetical protein